MKISDEDLNSWRYDQYRAPVSLRIVGDRAVAQKFFMGEAMNLLWTVKNAVKLNKRKEADGIRTWPDGTEIRIKCLAGMDIVEIDTSKSSLVLQQGILEEPCSITLVNLPLSVPPMQNPNKILPDEASGVDYFKTYYTIANPLGETTIYEPTFKFFTDNQIEYFNGEKDNHCVTSQDGKCSAQIISQGEDDGGGYIIWKALTEAKDHNRSGYGFIKFRIVSGPVAEDGPSDCEIIAIIPVDCCAREDVPPLKIFWEKTFSDSLGLECKGEDVLDYFGIQLCEIKDQIFLKDFFTVFSPSQKLRLFSPPEFSGCPPYQWNLDVGPGSLDRVDIETPSVIDRYIDYVPPGTTHCERVQISLSHRCDEILSKIVLSCCDHPKLEPLTLNYTTLVMGCGNSQSLWATGGCPPYVWTLLSGGGSLSDNGNGTAQYTAPGTNPNCVNNPVISLTDCCGAIQTITLAINCNPAGIAYRVVTWSPKTSFSFQCTLSPPTFVTLYYFNIKNYYYNCDGSLNSVGPDLTTNTYLVNDSSVPTQEPGIKCGYTDIADGCGRNGADNCYPCTSFGDFTVTFGTIALCGPIFHGAIYDLRTPAMKAAGCCPPALM